MKYSITDNTDNNKHSGNSFSTVPLFLQDCAKKPGGKT